MCEVRLATQRFSAGGLQQNRLTVRLDRSNKPRDKRWLFLNNAAIITWRERWACQRNRVFAMESCLCRTWHGQFAGGDQNNVWLLTCQCFHCITAVFYYNTNLAMNLYGMPPCLKSHVALRKPLSSRPILFKIRESSASRRCCKITWLQTL